MWDFEVGQDYFVVFELWHRVVWCIDTSVSEEHTASVFSGICSSETLVSTYRTTRYHT